MRPLGVEDIPGAGYPLTKPQRDEISREQSSFYQAKERGDIASIASALDRMNTRIWKILTQAITTESNRRNLFRGSESNSIVQIGAAIFKNFTQEAVEGFFQDHHAISMLIYNTYHPMAKGASITKEPKALENPDEFIRKAVVDFDNLGGICKHFFELKKDYNLFISEKRWAITDKYDFLSWIFSDDSVEGQGDLIDLFNSLSVEEISFLSHKSLFKFSEKLLQNDEHHAAISVLEHIREGTVDAEIIYKVHMSLGHIFIDQQDFKKAFEAFGIALVETKKSGEWDRRYTYVMGLAILSALLSGSKMPTGAERFFDKAGLFSFKTLNLMLEIKSVQFCLQNNNATGKKMASFLKKMEIDYLGGHPDFEKAELFEAIHKRFVQNFERPPTDEAPVYLREQLLKIYDRHHRWGELKNLLPAMIEHETNIRKKARYEERLNDVSVKHDALFELIRQSQLVFSKRNEVSKSKLEEMKENLMVFYEDAKDQNHSFAIEELLADKYHFGFRIGHGSDWMVVDDYKGNWMKLARLCDKIQHWRHWESDESVNVTLLELIQKAKQLAEKIGTTYSKSFALDRITSHHRNYKSNKERLEDLKVLHQLQTDQDSQRLAHLVKVRAAQTYRTLGLNEKAYSMLDEAIDYFSNDYPGNAIWQMERKASWLNQDKRHSEAIEAIRTFAATHTIQPTSLIILSTFEARSLMAIGTKDNLERAQGLLENTSQLILAKKSIMESHYGNYSRTLARLIACYIMTDREDKLESFLSTIHETATFDRSTILYIALGIHNSEKLGTTQSTIKYYFRKARIDFEENNQSLGFISLMNLIRKLDKSNDASTIPTLGRVFQMAIQRRGFFEVNALMDLILRSKNIRSSLRSIINEDSLDGFFESCDEPVQTANYLKTKARLAKSSEERYNHYNSAYELYKRNSRPVQGSMILKQILEEIGDGPKHENFERKLIHDMEHNLAPGLLHCLSKMPYDYGIEDETLIETLQNLAKEIPGNSSNHEHYLNLINDKFRHRWRTSNEMANKKQILLSLIADGQFLTMELQIRRMLGSALADADCARAKRAKKMVNEAHGLLLKGDLVSDWNLYRLFGETLQEIALISPASVNRFLKQIEDLIQADYHNQKEQMSIFYLHRTSIRLAMHHLDTNQACKYLNHCMDYVLQLKKPRPVYVEIVLESVEQMMKQLDDHKLNMILEQLTKLKRRLPPSGRRWQSISTTLNALIREMNDLVASRKRGTNSQVLANISFDDLNSLKRDRPIEEKGALNELLGRIGDEPSNKPMLMLKSNIHDFRNLNLYPSTILHLFSFIRRQLLSENNVKKASVNTLDDAVDQFLESLPEQDESMNIQQERIINARRAILFSKNIQKWFEKATIVDGVALPAKDVARLVYELGESKSALKKSEAFIENFQRTGLIFFMAAELFHGDQNIEKARRYYAKAQMLAEEVGDQLATQKCRFRLAQLTYNENQQEAMKLFSIRMKECMSDEEKFNITRRHYAIFHCLVSKKHDVAHKIFSEIYNLDEPIMLVNPVFKEHEEGYVVQIDGGGAVYDITKKQVSLSTYNKFRKAKSHGNGIMLLDFTNGRVNEVYFPSNHMPYLELSPQ